MRRALARSRAPRRRAGGASSRARPTNVLASVALALAVRARTASHARTARPSLSPRPALPARTRWRRASRRYVSSPTRTPLTGAAGLQTRGSVDDVAGDHRLAERRPRAERDERLAGVDGDAELESAAADAVAHGQRRAHRPLRVVAEGGRRAEHRHHRVADELLDDAAEGLELVADRARGRARASRGRPRDRGSRPRAVKPTRSTKTTLTMRRSSPSAASAGSERRRAREAEPRDIGIFLGAGRTNQHRKSVRRPPRHGKRYSARRVSDS